MREGEGKEVGMGGKRWREEERPEAIFGVEETERLCDLME